VYILYIVVCPFVFFLLIIVLSVLRFTDYDYPFGIVKLVLMGYLEVSRMWIGNIMSLLLVLLIRKDWS